MRTSRPRASRARGAHVNLRDPYKVFTFIDFTGPYEIWKDWIFSNLSLSDRAVKNRIIPLVFRFPDQVENNKNTIYAVEIVDRNFLCNSKLQTLTMCIVFFFFFFFEIAFPFRNFQPSLQFKLNKFFFHFFFPLNVYSTYASYTINACTILHAHRSTHLHQCQYDNNEHYLCHTVFSSAHRQTDRSFVTTLSEISKWYWPQQIFFFYSELYWNIMLTTKRLHFN